MSNLNIDPNAGHYDVGGISTLDVIQAKLDSLDGWTHYQASLYFQVLKYALRMPFKGQVKSDMNKIRLYLDLLEKTDDF